jgi:alkyl sulfatase BDS1-like metallo-beta-lactamase superfamily hydrolase
MRYPRGVCVVLAFIGMGLSPADVRAQGQQSTDPMALFNVGRDQTAAFKVNEYIYEAFGFGNTFMVVTPAGNVIIDTSIVFMAPRHKQLLTSVSDAPVRYIILTHGHGDHTGGVRLWKGEDTQIIAQENFVEFQHYQARLRGLFARRNAAQFPRLVAAGGVRGTPQEPSPGNYAAEIVATTLFDETLTFQLGGLTFELYHTPGETYDHLTVWIPELKAAFTGDNYYESFPNLYTLRGTEPRYALDYVESLNKVMELGPELLLPSHGQPIRGNDEIVRALRKYRDAILYVHDATVQGMNAGKDVYTLMQEIKLPPELDVGEGYGTIGWSVRGIYEGYIGWFDGNPATMYETPASAVYPDLVEMAGGAESVAARAESLRQEGKLQEALRLADIALAADPENLTALKARLAAFESLRGRSRNSNESGWLEYGMTETKKRIERAEEFTSAPEN